MRGRRRVCCCDGDAGTQPTWTAQCRVKDCDFSRVTAALAWRSMPGQPRREVRKSGGRELPANVQPPSSRPSEVRIGLSPGVTFRTRCRSAESLGNAPQERAARGVGVCGKAGSVRIGKLELQNRDVGK